MIRTFARFVAVVAEEIGEQLIIAPYIRRVAAGKARSGFVVVTAAGQGSVGDEAMYRVCAKSGTRPTTVVHHREDDLLVPPSELGASELVIDRLVYGRGVWRHLRAFRKFIPHMVAASSLGVIGADMMDGIYNERVAARRFRLIKHGASLGLDSRLLGFSWAKKPAPLAKRAMRRTPRNAELLARDPLSAERLRLDGGKNVIEAADLAFLTGNEPELEDHELRNWLDAQEQQQKPVVIINANPRIAALYPHQDDAYIALIKDLISEGYSLLALAHDSRHGANGEPEHLRRLFEDFIDLDQAFVVSGVLTPEEVVSVASRCALVVSGRMHLVILSAVAGTPAVGLEYQDKFEGLYEHLGYDARVPVGDVRNELPKTVSEALDDREDLRERIQHSLPKLRALAERNIP